MCGPPGPPIENGEAIVLFFLSDDKDRTRPYWTNIIEAAHMDPRVAAAYPDLAATPIAKPYWMRR